MKIVELIFSVAVGGAERLVVDLCNNLAKNDNDEVILLTVCDDRLPANSGLLPDVSSKVRFVSLRQPKGLSPRSLMAIYRFIRNDRPDIVHCHSILILLYLPMLLLRGTYIHTLHSTAQHCLGPKWLRIINRFFYKNKVLPVTISNGSSLSFRNLYGLRNDVIIPNGRKALRCADERPSDMCKSTDGYTFIHIANCRPMKNQDRMFRVFCRLQQEEVPFDLFCLGADYDVYMERFAGNRQIHILGERRDVSPYLSFADFMVLSSDYEGLPISILEGMSLGVAPICTPAGGIVNVIRDGENGYLSDDFTDESLYSKVKQAIAEYGKISRDALSREFEEKYSIEVCAGNYYELYKTQ